MTPQPHVLVHFHQQFAQRLPPPAVAAQHLPSNRPNPRPSKPPCVKLFKDKRRLEAELTPDGNVVAAGKRANDRKAEKRSQSAPTNTDIGIGHVREEAEQVAVEDKTRFEFKRDWEWEQQEG
jgi:hypothetical protein